jgi:hypothetical protein
VERLIEVNKIWVDSEVFNLDTCIQLPNLRRRGLSAISSTDVDNCSATFIFYLLLLFIFSKDVDVPNSTQNLIALTSPYSLTTSMCYMWYSGVFRVPPFYV